MNTQTFDIKDNEAINKFIAENEVADGGINISGDYIVITAKADKSVKEQRAELIKKDISNFERNLMYCDLQRATFQSELEVAETDEERKKANDLLDNLNKQEATFKAKLKAFKALEK